MRYSDGQLLNWYEAAHARPLPRGMSRLSVDREAGVLHLVLNPDHDGVAVQALLDQFPQDAVSVVISDERWYGYGPETEPDSR
jgi:hypothetical protein